jgi:hypothetical protein
LSGLGSAPVRKDRVQVDERLTHGGAKLVELIGELTKPLAQRLTRLAAGPGSEQHP